MLLFADDVVLLAESLAKLQQIFGFFNDFCTSHKLTINADKTKLLVAGIVDPVCAPSSFVSFGDKRFECVDRFKYLGVVFDRRASCRTMLEGILTKSRKSMYWMLRFI